MEKPKGVSPGGGPTRTSSSPGSSSSIIVVNVFFQFRKFSFYVFTFWPYIHLDIFIFTLSPPPISKFWRRGVASGATVRRLNIFLAMTNDDLFGKLHPITIGGG